MSIIPLVTPADFASRFARLADDWERETAHQSSGRRREGHAAHREIVSMGEAAVPLLLRDLQSRGRRWFAALHAITGANPVSAQDAGQFDRMREAWLAWGRDRGYDW